MTERVKRLAGNEIELGMMIPTIESRASKLVARCCSTERVKRLAGNEIELGIEIPTIESRASNILMTKGTTYVVMGFDRERSSQNVWEPI